MKKGMKRYWINIIVISVLMLAISVVVTITLFQNQKEMKAGVVVSTTSYTGQGVIYEITRNEIIIVTTAHVLTGFSAGDNVTIVFPDETSAKAQIKYISNTADVSFLSINLTTQINTSLIKTVNKDRKIFDQIKEKDAVYTEYCGAGEIISPFIFLTDFNMDMMLIRLEAKSGMSGSGVFDNNGIFLGIICGSNEDETAVLPFSVIESEWSMVE